MNQTRLSHPGDLARLRKELRLELLPLSERKGNMSYFRFAQGSKPLIGERNLPRGCIRCRNQR